MKRKLLERYAVVDKDGHTTDGYYTGVCIGKYRLLLAEDENLELDEDDGEFSKLLRESKMSKQNAVDILQQAIYFGIEVYKSMQEEERERALEDIEEGKVTIQ